MSDDAQALILSLLSLLAMFVPLWFVRDDER